MNSPLYYMRQEEEFSPLIEGSLIDYTFMVGVVSQNPLQEEHQKNISLVDREIARILEKRGFSFHPGALSFYGETHFRKEGNLSADGPTLYRNGKGFNNQLDHLFVPFGEFEKLHYHYTAIKFSEGEDNSLKNKLSGYFEDLRFRWHFHGYQQESPFTKKQARELSFYSHLSFFDETEGELSIELTGGALSYVLPGGK